MPRRDLRSSLVVVARARGARALVAVARPRASRGGASRHDAAGAVASRACAGLPAGRGAATAATREFLAARRRPERSAARRSRRSRDAAWREGGFLLSNCHGVMHTVGRTYARDAGRHARGPDGLPAAEQRPRLQRRLRARARHRRRRRESTRRGRARRPRVCGERRHAVPALQLRARLRPRVHADLRRSARAGARGCAAALGPRPAADCAQGAYHDYWFAVVGADDAALPEERGRPIRARLCGAQPAAFVRPCWYRAFVDNRPEGIVVDSPRGPRRRSARASTGLQREACVTGAAVIGPADPAAQLELCAAAARRRRTQPSCIRGTKVQNLLGSRRPTFVRLIGRCELFAGAAAARACYRWLGKARRGAHRRRVRARAAARSSRRRRRGASARAGARTMEEALVTFS